jgi:protein-S-isoprenylcysteine O-methyltransferase Ste14
MRATDFEFRQRFWIFGAIYGIAFYCYRFDHVNTGAALLHWLAPSISEDTPAGMRALHIIFGVSALFLVAFAAIRTWATAYLKTDVVQDSKIRTEALVGDGPYRHVRNPLYFANLLMAIGLGMLASRLGWLIAVGGTLLFQYRLILREESELLRTQGERYRAFLSAVPRFFPAIRPRIPSSGITPKWGQAFAGESFFWMFTLGSLCFAITLDLRLAGICLGVSMLGYFVMQFAGKRRSKRSAA